MIILLLSKASPNYHNLINTAQCSAIIYDMHVHVNSRYNMENSAFKQGVVGSVPLD